MLYKKINCTLLIAMHIMALRKISTHINLSYPVVFDCKIIILCWKTWKISKRYYKQSENCKWYHSQECAKNSFSEYNTLLSIMISYLISKPLQTILINFFDNIGINDGDKNIDSFFKLSYDHDEISTQLVKSIIEVYGNWKCF